MSSPFFLRCAAVACCAAMLLGLVPAARGQEALRETSLKWIPADAAFYGSLLRNQEQFERVAQSRAVQKIKEHPMAALGLAMLRAQWENPEDETLRQVKTWYEAPENKALVSFLVDALSDEVFLYGGDSFAEMIELANLINRANTQAQLEAIRSGQPLDEEQSQAVAEAMVKLVLEHSDEIEVPDLVIGFRIDDADRARAQLARLEELAREQLQAQPQIAERLKREKIGDDEFLTLRLDGSLAPWEEWMQENEENRDVDPELLKKVADVFREKTLTVSIGVREDYLLLSVGDTNEHLAKLGQGPLLVDREELAPLRKFADKPLTSIGYVSEEFRRESIESNQQQIAQMFSLFEAMVRNPEAIEEAGDIDLDKATRRELAGDLRKLREEIMAAYPAAGAGLGFSFLTSAGYEGYGYNWTENQLLDASRPLTILNHVGGSPLAFFAARKQYSPKTYDRVVHWIKRAFYYGEKLGLKELDEEQRAAYEDFRGQAIPLLMRLDLANRELLIPAFRDGQGALVLDAKSKSEAWHAMMPPPQKPLPMLELGVIYGVSDAAALKQGAVEYLLVAREIWEKAQAAAAEARKKAIEEGKPAEVPELPDFEIVYPSERETDVGTTYFYRLPAEWGLDERLAPNAALSERFLAFSLLPEFSERLLAEKPLEVSLPADPDTPLGAAAHLNFAGVVDVIGAWINYGVDVQAQMKAAQAEQAEDADDPDDPAPPGDQPLPVEPQGPSPEETKKQIHFVLDLLKCYRGFSSVTYREDAATVTHYQSRFQDLEE